MLTYLDFSKNPNYTLGTYQQSINLLFRYDLLIKKKLITEGVWLQLYTSHENLYSSLFFVIHYLLGKVRISWVWSDFLSSLSQKILNNFIYCGMAQIIALKEILFSCATLTWKASSWFSSWNIFVVKRFYTALQFMNYSTVSMDTSQCRHK